jgi:hypothetical protein
LRIIGVLGAAGLIDRLSMIEAEACGAPGAPCKKNAACCSGRCKKKRGKKRGRCQQCPFGQLECAGACRECCGDVDCPGGMACAGGACPCPAGTGVCRGPVAFPVCCSDADACQPGLGCTTAACRDDNAECDDATVCGGTADEPCFCGSALTGVLISHPVCFRPDLACGMEGCANDSQCEPGHACVPFQCDPVVRCCQPLCPNPF